MIFTHQGLFRYKHCAFAADSGLYSDLESMLTQRPSKASVAHQQCMGSGVVCFGAAGGVQAKGHADPGAARGWHPGGQAAPVA